jgi:5-methyltetrahydropteroyltriglutamate--homocysteine methyltransferase
MIAAHADVVGSLLRPPELLRARDEIAAGRMTPARFKEIEDRAVDWAVQLQEVAGLEVVTDGEMRRLSFQSQMTEAVEGFGRCDLDAFVWGDWQGVDGAEDWRRERPRNLAVVGKLVRARHLSAEEFVYLRARTRHTPKVTLPSPGLFVNFWSPDGSREAYPTLDEFLADVVRNLARRRRRACAPGRHLHPDRRPPLPLAPRSEDPGLLRIPGLVDRRLARPRDRTR